MWGRTRVSTVTVADRRAGKVVGKPYWGKPDVRFDEGAEGTAVMGNWEPAAHTERGRVGNPPLKPPAPRFYSTRMEIMKHER